MEILILLGMPVLLLFVGLICGTVSDYMHILRLERRERGLAGMLVTNLRSYPRGPGAGGAKLVTAELVIAGDYMKSFRARIRNLLGGELRSYSGLLTRARREVVVRILEQAREKGCNAVCNVRFNTTEIGAMAKRNSMPMIELIACGTAYRTSEAIGG